MTNNDLTAVLLDRLLERLGPLSGQKISEGLIAQAKTIASSMLQEMLQQGELLPFGSNEPFEFLADPDTRTLVVRLYPTFAIFHNPDGAPA